MTINLNRAQLLGNIGRDPEFRATSHNARVCNFTVATSEHWKDKSTGERKEKTEWHKVSLFGPLVDLLEPKLKKGVMVYLEGKLQTRKWTDKDSIERYSTEIVISGGGGGGELVVFDRVDKAAAPAPTPRAPPRGSSAPKSGAIEDDDIPFSPEYR